MLKCNKCGRVALGTVFKSGDRCLGCNYGAWESYTPGDTGQPATARTEWTTINGIKSITLKLEKNDYSIRMEGLSVEDALKLINVLQIAIGAS